MLGEIGTLAWTRRTNGLLTRPERARYIAAAVMGAGFGIALKLGPWQD